MGDGDIQTVTSASVIAAGGDPHHEYDTGSAEADNLQNKDQTDPIASTSRSGEAQLSIAGFSEQALALIAVSASSLSSVGEDGLAIVDISKLTTVKVLDNGRACLELSTSASSSRCGWLQTWRKGRRWDAFTSRVTRTDLYETDGSGH